MNRRQLLSMLPAGLAATVLVGLPGVRARAAAASSERKFLFIHCKGGWDTSCVFHPPFDMEGAEYEDHATLTEIGGIPLVDSPQRPFVRTFFESYADRCCVINGIENRSVTHERCQQLMLTGRSDNLGDDWGSILAAHSDDDLLIPHAILSGAAFSSRYMSQVVRVGSSGQLQDLLDGQALSGSDVAVEAPGDSVEALLDEHVANQARLFGQGVGSAAATAQVYEGVLDDLQALRELDDVLELTEQLDGCTRSLTMDCSTAFDLFELGLSRCAMVQSNGWCDTSWDTHKDNYMQSTHFEELFTFLAQAMEDLETRVAPDGSPLKEQVTLVVMSEMGRHPRYNTWEGRDHWTFTSQLLIGSGVQGGRAVGGLDESGLGLSIDLEDGEASDSGVSLVAGHLGATLLALGDVDPGEYLAPGEEPIDAAMG